MNEPIRISFGTDRNSGQPVGITFTGRLGPPILIIKGKGYEARQLFDGTVKRQLPAGCTHVELRSEDITDERLRELAGQSVGLVVVLTSLEVTPLRLTGTHELVVIRIRGDNLMVITGVGVSNVLREVTA